MEKKCTRCAKTMDTKKFYALKAQKDGLDYLCIKCRTKSTKKFHDNKRFIKNVVEKLSANYHKKIGVKSMKKIKDNISSYFSNKIDLVGCQVCKSKNDLALLNVHTKRKYSSFFTDIKIKGQEEVFNFKAPNCVVLCKDCRLKMKRSGDWTDMKNIDDKQLFSRAINLKPKKEKKVC